ncbi:hypothetical protein [Paludisphaera mucosa]|uniref:Lipoprotein LpqN n=1 Tax=Paludisphaera mucosa TaxID=3030827 RepID=A0ABT6F5H9_9BACT|nr:hypothetical protein [Paludisphaera mucosa]MDG3002674.1 hypothetical protein [Paludisphaera mucosa]
MAHASMVLARRGVCVVAVVLLILGSGCESASPTRGPLPTITLPAAWKPADPATWRAPGTRLAAWSGPANSALIVYRTVPDPGGTAETVVETLFNRFTHLPGYDVRERRVETIAGVPAARVEIVAPGTGVEIAPSGLGEAAKARDGEPALTPTREITVGFPRPDGSLFLVWRLPESAHGQLGPEIESALATLVLPPSSTRTTY